MLAHEAALIDVSAYAVDMSFTCVLPHSNITIVLQPRFKIGVLGNHDFVVVELSLKVLVVEVRTRVDEGLLAISLLDELKEEEQRVAERFGGETAGCFDVDHRQ